MLYEESDSKKKRAVYLTGIMLLSDGHRRDEKKLFGLKNRHMREFRQGLFC